MDAWSRLEVQVPLTTSSSRNCQARLRALWLLVWIPGERHCATVGFADPPSGAPTEWYLQWLLVLLVLGDAYDASSRVQLMHGTVFIGDLAKK